LINKEKSNSAGIRPGAILLFALFIAYPVAIHAAVINGYAVAALLMLLLVPVFLTSRSRAGGLFAALAAAAVVALLAATLEHSEQLLLYLMPVLMNAALAVFFGRTLIPGETPLITRFSILLRGKLEPRVVSYTRRVTQVWTLFFILLALESLLLALFTPLEIWSLFANILNYLFAGLLFAGEYCFRVHHLHDLEHPDFLRFVRSLSQVDPRVVNKQ
jgi:uncharacterized membrane protein